MCVAGAWRCNRAGAPTEEAAVISGGRGAADVGAGGRSSADNEEHAVIPWQPAGLTSEHASPSTEWKDTECWQGKHFCLWAAECAL